jgi:hypothetical protein
MKGDNYLTCDQELTGDNCLSVAYAPGPRGGSGDGVAKGGKDVGHMFVAWENGGGPSWQPAGCSAYVKFDIGRWME